MSRWERLTRTRGRVAITIGVPVLWVAIGLLLSQDFLLGTPEGPYVAIVVFFVWLGLLGALEARWRREEGAKGHRTCRASRIPPPGP